MSRMHRRALRTSTWHQSRQLTRWVPSLFAGGALIAAALLASPAGASPPPVSLASTTLLIPVLGSAAPLRLALNPLHNIAPQPNFLTSGSCHARDKGWSCSNPCVDRTMGWGVATRNPACTQLLVRAINNARRREHVITLQLPSTWLRLTPAEQLFVVADLERTARGLPPYLGLNAALSATAQRAASHRSDPGLAAGFSVGTDAEGSLGMGGAWSAGFSVLAADYMWMYNDGWGGPAGTSNSVCTSAGASGCWAHRDQLLGADPHFNAGVGLHCAKCEMGAGFAKVGGTGSYVDLVELPRAGAPPMYFTWARDVKPYL